MERTMAYGSLYETAVTLILAVVVVVIGVIQVLERLSGLFQQIVSS
jgi:hypothetical protein